MRKIVAIVLLLFGFAMSLSITKVYGLSWDNNIVQTSTNASIGTWEFIVQWSSAVRYNTGDKVIYNGVIYVALRTNTSKVPGANGSKNFWRVN